MLNALHPRQKRHPDPQQGYDALIVEYVIRGQILKLPTNEFPGFFLVVLKECLNED